jgi:hypothetical protein
MSGAANVYPERKANKKRQFRYHVEPKDVRDLVPASSRDVAMPAALSGMEPNHEALRGLGLR